MREKYIVKKRIQTVHSNFDNFIYPQPAYFDSIARVTDTQTITETDDIEEANRFLKIEPEVKAYPSQNEWKWVVIDYFFIYGCKPQAYHFTNWYCAPGILLYNGRILEDIIEDFKKQNISQEKIELLSLIKNERDCWILLPLYRNKFENQLKELAEPLDKKEWLEAVDWFFEQIYDHLAWRDGQNFVIGALKGVDG